ncbi:MAG: hypothetical protein IIA60_09045 [Candidatus Marinimicrobia bacterium]|nr:hypothetical protein [Candidatus Neomarinimicrobiota bacterium]
MGRKRGSVKAYYHLAIRQGKQASRVQLITFDSGAEKRAQAHAMQVRGTVMPVKAVYSVMNPDSVEALGPGFIVVKRRPKYNLVVNASFLYAEIE